MTVTFLFIVYLDSSEHERSKQQKRIEVLHKMESVKANLESRVNTSIAYTYGIVAYISTHHDISSTYFEQVAGGLIARGFNIRGISIAKDNVINLAYPPEQAKPVMGMNFLNVPEQREAWQRAIDTRRAVVAGPVDLVEKGFGFIPRTPVYLTPPDGAFESGRYWGMVSVIMDMTSLFEESGITNNKDLRIAMRGKDATGPQGEIFFGDKAVFDSDPVLLSVLFPEGSWQMAAVPADGWSALHQGHKWFMAGGIIFTLLSGSLVWVLMHHPIALREEIERVTNALRESEAREEEIKDYIEREERGRLARELHDGIGQSLVAIKLNLQMMKSGQVTVNEDRCARLIDDISNTTNEFKQILSDLSPLPPEAVINKSLKQLGTKAQEWSGIPVIVSSEGDFGKVAWRVKDNLYRICQEAMNNALKYSAADRIDILLSMEERRIFLDIRDNGKGFNYEAAKDKGFGISIMNERAKRIGGIIDIQSSPAKGTFVHVEAPI